VLGSTGCQNLSNPTHQGTREMCWVVQHVGILRFAVDQLPSASNNKMKNKKYHTVGTVPKTNTVEHAQSDTSVFRHPVTSDKKLWSQSIPLNCIILLE
jgi:hypothetical protein